MKRTEVEVLARVVAASSSVYVASEEVYDVDPWPIGLKWQVKASLAPTGHKVLVDNLPNEEIAKAWVQQLAGLAVALSITDE